MRKGGLVYAPYPFGEAKILKQRIGVSLFNSSMRIWESLSESDDNPDMTAQEWQKRSGGVRAKTVLALAEALANAQARFGESEFLSVERDGEKIRFRSKAIEGAFKARLKNREKVGEFRERKRKNSESFSENSESFSKSFETASPRSEHLSGNPPPCNGYLNNNNKNKNTPPKGGGIPCADTRGVEAPPLSAEEEEDRYAKRLRKAKEADDRYAKQFSKEGRV